MIDEYALIPDIFDPACYSQSSYIDMCLPHLKEALFNEAIVRDLGDGDWSRWCSDPERLKASHRLAGEILRKLEHRNRLHRFPKQFRSSPTDAEGWCKEALRSHRNSPLSGIMSSDQTKRIFSSEPLVASIEKLPGCQWWQSRSCSALLERTTESYLTALSRILKCANSLMFIDPNVDPTKKNYSEFFRLLAPLKDRRPAPMVEVHRSFCLGDGPGRKLLNKEQGRELFRPLDKELQSLGLNAEVFFWQDFHARYLITDLLGIVAEAGFDKTEGRQSTTWARLSSADRDTIQAEFDPDDRPRDLKFRVRIGDP